MSSDEEEGNVVKDTKSKKSKIPTLNLANVRGTNSNTSMSCTTSISTSTSSNSNTDTSADTDIGTITSVSAGTITSVSTGPYSVPTMDAGMDTRNLLDGALVLSQSKNNEYSSVTNSGIMKDCETPDTCLSESSTPRTDFQGYQKLRDPIKSFGLGESDPREFFNCVFCGRSVSPL
ncbi:MAG: hypothetical protein WD512_17960, partial [Candidatus Paceibacterota bacterium]